MIAKLEAFKGAIPDALETAMETAAENVADTAREYCTPGTSPYDTMFFPSKLKTHKGEHFITGAPYLTGALLDSIESNVTHDGTRIVGTVSAGNDDVDYALPVHEGTSKLAGRPFIQDAISDKMDETLATLENGLQIAILQSSEGNIFSGTYIQNGNVPTAPEYDMSGEEDLE